MIMLNALCNGVTRIPSLREQVSLNARWLRLKDRVERSRLMSHPCFSIVKKCLICCLIERAVLETVIDNIRAMDDDPVSPCTVIRRRK